MALGSATMAGLSTFGQDVRERRARLVSKLLGSLTGIEVCGYLKWDEKDAASQVSA